MRVGFIQMMTTGKVGSRVWLPVLLLTLTITGSGLAQELKSPAPAAGGIDTFLVIIPKRSLSSIQADIENATARERLSKANREQSESLRAMTDAQVAASKVNIETTSKSLSTAKKAKQAGEVTSLTAQLKAGEQVKQLLAHQSNLRKAEVELARAEEEFAREETKALQLELELARKRSERDSLMSQPTGNSLTVAGLTSVVHELESKTLRAQRELADAEELLAKRSKQLVAQRMTLFSSQNKLLGRKN